MNVIGNVKNKVCIILDDLVDSGGTIVNAAKVLKSKGAIDVYAYVCLLYTSPSPRDA